MLTPQVLLKEQWPRALGFQFRNSEFKTTGWFQSWLRNSPPEVFLGKCVLKMCSKFTGEHPRRSVISVKLQSNFIEITLQHECFPVDLLHIFRTSFSRTTSGGALRGVLRKRCFENMQQIYRGTLITKCDFNKIALQLC